MAFNVNEMISELNRRGVSKQSHFIMMITVPPKLQSLYGSYSEHLIYRIDSSEFPGRTISTTPYKEYGTIRKIGYEPNYPDVTASMIISSDMTERLLFTQWQNLIIGTHSTKNRNLQFDSSQWKNPDTGQILQIGPNPVEKKTESINNSQTANKPFNIGFYNDYVGTVTIVQYNEDGQQAYACTLVEAYPVLVGGMPLNWGSDELHRLTVQFVYRFFEEENFPLSSSFKQQSLLNRILGNSNVQGLIGFGIGQLARRDRGLAATIGQGISLVSAVGQTNRNNILKQGPAVFNTIRKLL